jgi:hypothetical protein
MDRTKVEHKLEGALQFSCMHTLLGRIWLALQCADAVNKLIRVLYNNTYAGKPPLKAAGSSLMPPADTALKIICFRNTSSMNFLKFSLKNLQRRNIAY